MEMYQHQHTPLPLEELEDVPQPLVVLLEVLLQKDPARRFQRPTELLKAMPDGDERYRRGAFNHSSQPWGDAPCRIASRKSRTANTTGTGENFRSQAARYR